MSDGTYLIDPDDHYMTASRLRVIDYAGLEGKMYFWDIVLHAQLPSVGLQAIELLNALHFYFAPRIKSKEGNDHRRQHVTICLGNLKNALEGLKEGKKEERNRMVVKRMIGLLKQFLSSFEVSGHGDSNMIEIEVRPDKEFRSPTYIERMKLSETFGALRKRILLKLAPLNSGLVAEHLILKWREKVCFVGFLVENDFLGEMLENVENARVFVRFCSL